jgi:ATP/ADP translocase
MLCAGVLTAQFVAGTTTRDSLYFASLSVSSLPQILLATAGFSILIVIVTGTAFRRMAPTIAVPAALGLSAAAFMSEWVMVRYAPALAAQAVYLHVSGFTPVIASGFWLIVTEQFDPRTAKRRFGHIAAVGTAGGVAGGLLAERIATFFGTPAMLPVLAALSLVSALQIHALPDAAPGHDTLELSPELVPASPRSGLRVLASTPYLRDLAALVLLGTMGAVLVDYSFRAHAVARFGRGEDLLRFFAIYYVAVNVITFIVQVSSSRMVLERFGLTVATAMPSAAVMLGGIGALLVPGLPGTIVARGGQAVFRGSLFRSGYEVFYTPVSSADKRAAKSVIDVGFDKLGDAAGAGLIRVVQWLAFASQLSAVLGAAVVCSALALAVSTRLRGGYVQALEASLRNRAVELDLTEVHDTLTRTIALRVRQPHVPMSAPSPAAPITARPDTELLSMIDLRSRDRARVVTVLRASGGIGAPMVPTVISLLAWDAVADEAVRALRTVAALRIGQLTDALLDQEQPFAIRRRVARVFSACPTQRAVDGLMLGLDDPRFEVRFQCGRALAAMLSANPGLHIDAARTYSVVRREATVSRHVWQSRPLLDRVEHEDGDPFVEALTLRATQSLAHVFTILSLTLPREPLRIAFRGLHTDDQRLRGTALEYLELILPPSIHERLWPFLAPSTRAGNARRSPETVVAELLQSNESILLNLSDLKRRSETPGPEVIT